MHEFRYKNNHLYCENLKVEDIARVIPTPFYLYSAKTILEHFFKLKNAFQKIHPLICFSMKANSNLAILKLLVLQGAGLDIVSGGELYKAIEVRCSSKRIVYASVGKTEYEIAQAIKKGILLFNVESVPELNLINQQAKRLKRKVDVSLRLNPQIKIDTHEYIHTSKGETKFGIDLKTAKALFLKKDQFSNLNLIGLHIHIGSQITKSAPFLLAIKKVYKLIQDLKTNGVNLTWFNIGGGLGIVYKKERPQTASEFANKILPLLKKINLKVILEPGRFIVGNAGILVTRIIYVKDTPKKRFIIVDAGMNDFIRPSLYDAYHEIIPLIQNKEPRVKKRVDIVGPVCESGDFLGKDRLLPELKSGDLLAVMGAGAYGFTMSSNYNSRPRISEVIVKKRKFFLVKKRESYRDLIKGEVIPQAFK